MRTELLSACAGAKLRLAMNPNDTPFARDMDLVRDILIWMERGAPREERPAKDDDRKFAYHCRIMKDAGLIDAAVIEEPACRGSLISVPVRANVKSLAWKGHEALDAIRNDTVWQKTKSKIAEHGLPLVFDLALSVAKGIAAQHGVPLG